MNFFAFRYYIFFALNYSQFSMFLARTNFVFLYYYFFFLLITFRFSLGSLFRVACIQASNRTNQSVSIQYKPTIYPVKPYKVYSIYLGGYNIGNVDNDNISSGDYMTSFVIVAAIARWLTVWLAGFTSATIMMASIAFINSSSSSSSAPLFLGLIIVLKHWHMFARLLHASLQVVGGGVPHLFFVFLLQLCVGLFLDLFHYLL